MNNEEFVKTHKDFQKLVKELAKHYFSDGYTHHEVIGTITECAYREICEAEYESIIRSNDKNF